MSLSWHNQIKRRRDVTEPQHSQQPAAAQPTANGSFQPRHDPAMVPVHERQEALGPRDEDDDFEAWLLQASCEPFRSGASGSAQPAAISIEEEVELYLADPCSYTGSPLEYWQVSIDDVEFYLTLYHLRSTLSIPRKTVFVIPTSTDLHSTFFQYRRRLFLRSECSHRARRLSPLDDLVSRLR